MAGLDRYNHGYPVIGKTLSHFRITAKLGEGGMGEVYRAKDTRLDREVALKFVREDFAQDEAHLDRFEREAKVLASLNHPHIAAIHGLEEADDVRFLVLELVEGDTLTEVLGRGPLAVGEALEICRQVAEAVAAAHALGVVHRDLKPGNIKITAEGTVKVLDFGIARVAPKLDATAPDFTESPTMTDDGTQAGRRVGTASYMSPEQVRGQPVDEQADIWSFGCVLYELLAARRAFQGETKGDTAAAILEHEPDWSLLPNATPRRIRLLLQRCLRKDRSHRLHNISDARIEIEEEDREDVEIPLQPGRRQRMALWFLAAMTVALLVLIAIGITNWNSSQSAPAAAQEPTRLSINLPPGQSLVGGMASSLSLSPDGSHMVYVSQNSALNLRAQLYVRAFDEFTARAVPGSEDAWGPFFSPDGQWVGFFAAGKLWKVSVAGGAPVAICDAANVATGATWGLDDTILFTTFGSGVLQVSAAGGQPRSLTTPDSDNGELGHQSPQALPDDRGILFGIVTGKVGRIVVLVQETGELKSLVEGSNVARYLPTGHLLYDHQRSLWAVPFDLTRLETIGSPTRVLEDIGKQFAFSDSGTILYYAAPSRPVTLEWIDRAGLATPIVEPAGLYSHLNLSPDDNRIVFSNGPEGARDIWVYDLERGTRSRLTTDGTNGYPVWSPDGNRIVFSSTRGGNYDLYWQPADGSSGAESLLAKDYPQFPSSWTPDGKQLLFAEYHPNTFSDIWVMSTTGDPASSPVIATQFEEGQVQLSPDGKWLAFSADDSGRFEIYVQPFPLAGSRWQISTDGGGRPVWSRDEREIFYRRPDGGIVAVAVTTDPVFASGEPQLIFKGPITGRYDVAADGKRFLVQRVEAEQTDSPTGLSVVLNWFDELERLVPVP